jgi:hypothetical protein
VRLARQYHDLSLTDSEYEESPIGDTTESFSRRIAYMLGNLSSEFEQPEDAFSAAADPRCAAFVHLALSRELGVATFAYAVIDCMPSVGIGTYGG